MVACEGKSKAEAGRWLLVRPSLTKKNDQSFQCFSCGELRLHCRHVGHIKGRSNPPKSSARLGTAICLASLPLGARIPTTDSIESWPSLFSAVTCAMSYQWVEISKYRLNETKL